jgi:hypothetical protein
MKRFFAVLLIVTCRMATRADEAASVVWLMQREDARVWLGQPLRPDFLPPFVNRLFAFLDDLNQHSRCCQYRVVANRLPQLHQRHVVPQVTHDTLVALKPGKSVQAQASNQTGQSFVIPGQPVRTSARRRARTAACSNGVRRLVSKSGTSTAPCAYSCLRSAPTLSGVSP